MTGKTDRPALIALKEVRQLTETKRQSPRTGDHSPQKESRTAWHRSGKPLAVAATPQLKRACLESIPRTT